MLVKRAVDVAVVITSRPFVEKLEEEPQCGKSVRQSGSAVFKFTAIYGFEVN